VARSYYPTEDSKLNASRGLINGAFVRNIFGKSANSTSIVTGEFRAPWELASDYIFPDVPKILTVSSDVGNTSDNGVNVIIQGLDSNYNEISEVATINSASPYITTNQFWRVNDAVVISGDPIGNINVTNTAVTYSRINSGTGKSQAAVYTVPAGHCFYLYRIDAFATDSNGGKAASFRNFVQIHPTDVNFRVAETQFFDSMNIQRRFPFKYDQKSDIKLQLRSSSGSIGGSVFAEGIVLSEPMTP